MENIISKNRCQGLQVSSNPGQAWLLTAQKGWVAGYREFIPGHPI